jgi:hypothetical protein
VWDFVVEEVALGQVSVPVLWFPRSFPVDIIPPLLSILIYNWGINNRPVGVRGSETSSHPIDVKNKKVFSWNCSNMMIFYAGICLYA